MMLDDLRPGSVPRGGTAIAQALETALASFGPAGGGEADRAIVLVSDGEDHEGGHRAGDRRARARAGPGLRHRRRHPRRGRDPGRGGAGQPLPQGPRGERRQDRAAAGDARADRRGHRRDLRRLGRRRRRVGPHRRARHRHPEARRAAVEARQGPRGALPLVPGGGDPGCSPPRPCSRSGAGESRRISREARRPRGDRARRSDARRRRLRCRGPRGDRRARRALDEGVALFSAGRFEEAAARFEEAAALAAGEALDPAVARYDRATALLAAGKAARGGRRLRGGAGLARSRPARDGVLQSGHRPRRGRGVRRAGRRPEGGARAARPGARRLSRAPCASMRGTRMRR